ncbi:MAG: ester cyclase [Candidatus Thorarchaeota archaeon]|nr:MAG: ester cyclase [Candidatus Thorarchaeota archaeon]
MSVESNIRIIESVLDAFNQHDWDGFVEYYSDSVLNYGPGKSKPIKGREAILEDNIQFLKAFPDAHFEISHAFGQDDWVCAVGNFEGTHRGEFSGPGGQSIPPTGNVVRYPMCVVIKFESDKIVEFHEYFDSVEMARQLGFI